jgi:DNA-directed RNA polymerase subunit RPC12/RpoP
MSAICAWCGKPITHAVYFCRRCQLHFAWDHTNGGKCRRCGEQVAKIR